jgi:hypothetical protein
VAFRLSSLLPEKCWAGTHDGGISPDQVLDGPGIEMIVVVVRKNDDVNRREGVKIHGGWDASPRSEGA